MRRKEGLRTLFFYDQRNILQTTFEMQLAKLKPQLRPVELT